MLAHALPALELGHIRAHVPVELNRQSLVLTWFALFLRPALWDGEMHEVREKFGVEVLLEELSSETEGVLRPLEVVDEAEASGALIGMPPEVVERAEAGGALMEMPPSVSR
jgi:predicted lipid carrier protein YhbT